MIHPDLPRRFPARAALLLALLVFLLPGGGRSGPGPAPSDWARPELADSLFTGRYTTVPGAPDPHRQPGACVACHREGQVAGKSTVDENRCLECHDARAHDRRLHSVSGKPPADGSLAVPEHMPLVDGSLSCLTCHGAVCDPPRDNPSALRGGPRTRPETFCFQCHTAGEFAGLYPHGPGPRAPAQDRLQGLGLESTCVICHTAEPSGPGRPERWVATRQLCQRCHSDGHHEARHLGRFLQGGSARPEIADHLQAFESASGFALPRDEAGRMECITCHLPSRECRPAGDTGDLPAHGLRLPAGLLCLACHALDPMASTDPGKNR